MIKLSINILLILLINIFSINVNAKNLDKIPLVNLDFIGANSRIEQYFPTTSFVQSKVNQVDQAEGKKIPQQGHLVINSINGTEKLNVLIDRYSAADNKKLTITKLPSISFDYAVYQNYIIPNIRTVQRNKHPNWEWQVSPGVFWTEKNDNDYSRVVFPFSLQEKNANCTHNGLMLFMINSKGKTTNGVVQIASETCAYFQFDLATRVSVNHTNNKHFDYQSVVDKFKKELSDKTSVQSKTSLIKDYPELELKKLRPVKPRSSTTSGLLIKGKHYRLNCETRYGPYPYCDWLALPSYSTAKSIFAGIALMRLQALVPNVDKVLVTKMIPECKNNKWANATLSDLINMRTGNYYSKNAHGDEASSRMMKFFFATTHQDKVTEACEMFPHKSDPGKKFKYHTSDTYLAGVMLNQIFSKVSDQTDVYQSLLVDDLWTRLNLSPLLNESKRTYDAKKQTFTGWGLTYYADDILKIAKFLQQQKNATKQDRLLDQALLNSALQNGKDYLNRGGGEANIAYNNGFWALEVGGTLGCKERKWLPFMSGFGGITVALISPDMTYYNYADSGVFRWLDIIVELNQQFPLCEML